MDDEGGKKTEASVGSIGGFATPSSPPAKAHFGDMLGSELAQSMERALLARIKHPLDRVLLSADGTLQLLVSAWHARTVQVKVKKHVPNTQDLTVDREVDLCFADDASQTPFCTAKSSLKFADMELMNQARVFGIGQLFREINQLPRFELLTVEKNSDNDSLGRSYRMYSKVIECNIHETFPRNPLLVKRDPSVASLDPLVTTTVNPGFLSNAGIAPSELTSVQRLFCMAHGNVQRISGALLGDMVDVRLIEERKTNEILPRTYFREVELMGASSGYSVCNARSEIVIDNPVLVDQIDSGNLQLGSLLKYLGDYPTFKLLEVSWTSPTYFSRKYELSFPVRGVLIRVEEDFQWHPDSGLGEISLEYSDTEHSSG